MLTLKQPLFLKRLTFAGLSLSLTLGICLFATPATSATSPPSAVLPAKSPMPANMHITADKQSYNMPAKSYDLTGHVIVTYQEMQISGTKAHVEMNAAGKPQIAHFVNRPLFKRTKAGTNSVDTVVGDIINIYLNDDRYAAQGTVESHIATIAADPFFIRSDVQEFDNKNKVVSASGSVKVDYQGSKAFSPIANVRMKEDGKADRVIFSGGAKIIKDDTVINGEKITVMVDSGNLIAERNVETRVEMKKKSQASDPDKAIITSDYQQYDKASDTMLASGHVKILYGDYVAVGPKATFKMKDKELDRIFLTGRPTITENGRVVTADKITIMTNPKNFDAAGNVKVNFKTTDKGAIDPMGTAKPAATTTVMPVKKSITPSKGLPQDDPSNY